MNDSLDNIIQLHAKASEGVHGDRFHNGNNYCKCPCHGIFEFYDFFYKGCVACQLENENDHIVEITKERLDKCNCGYKPRICLEHRCRFTKKAN